MCFEGYFSIKQWLKIKPLQKWNDFIEFIFITPLLFHSLIFSMVMFTHRNALLAVSLIMLNKPFAEHPALCIVESIVSISHKTFRQRTLKDSLERNRHRVPTPSISRSSNPLASIIVSFNPSPISKMHDSDSTMSPSGTVSSSLAPTFSLINALSNSTNNNLSYSQNESHIPSMFPSSLNTFNSSEPKEKDRQERHNNTHKSNKNETQNSHIIRAIGITLLLLTISFFSFFCFMQNYYINHNLTKIKTAPRDFVGLNSADSTEKLLTDSSELSYHKSIDHAEISKQDEWKGYLQFDAWQYDIRIEMFLLLTQNICLWIWSPYLTSIAMH